MNPPNDSPLWPILRMLVIGLVLAVLLHIGYANGFSPDVDVPTIIGTILAAGGIDGLQKLLGRKSGLSPDCERYNDALRHWKDGKTYAELEAEEAALRAEIKRLKNE